MTCEMLDSLQQVSYENYEVVVVDNGSGPADVDLIRRRHPWVRLICNGENLGFTGGNNAGIRVADGEYILLLNNDTIVDRGFLEPIVAAIQHDPSVGIVSPKIRFFEPADRIQYAGTTPINPLTVRGETIGYLERDEGQYDEPCYTHLAHGAAMLIHRKVLEQVGLLADVFFLYYEEFDLCERAKRAGYRIRYVPQSVIWHKESATTGRWSAFKHYYMAKNRLLFVRRNVTGVKRTLAMLFIAAVALPKDVAGHVLSGRWASAAAVVRGLCWHLGRRDVHANIFLQPAMNRAAA